VIVVCQVSNFSTILSDEMMMMMATVLYS